MNAKEDKLEDWKEALKKIGEELEIKEELESKINKQLKPYGVQETNKSNGKQ